MSLISAANLRAFTDRLGACYSLANPVVGTKAGNAAAGTLRGTITNLQTDILAYADSDQELAFLSDVKATLAKATTEAALLAMLQGQIASLTNHLASLGSSVASSIVDIPSFLSYYNGGSGGNKFSSMCTPDFAALYLAVIGSALPVAGVMSPAIQPDLNTAGSSHGMGDRAVSASFTDGDAVVTASYSEVTPLIEVTTTFVNGSTHPTVTLTGTDDQGNACTYGAVDLGANNPTGALSGITVTPALTAGSRQTVALSSVTGIIAGSVLTINKNLPDQEVIVVEQVISSTIVAVFRKAHSSSATVDGWQTIACGNNSNGSARRLRDLTNLTVAVGAHNAGKVRIAGMQDRVSV